MTSKKRGFGFILLALLLGSAAGGASADEHSLIREPYLQLGDAPLVGYAGSHQDQVEVIWQSNGTPLEPISFHYRRSNSDSWTQLTSIRHDELTEGRVNHSVVLKGLDFDTRYEYRVEHGSSVYTADFRTRLASGSAKPFVFAAYGDSTDPRSIELFNQVQSAINQSGASFAVLLGDNAYPDGTHADYDNRF
ncbi:MAG: fibronectin type III domain-containing protein, partial [Acidimicrobiia bacterium]|nr:fibronectin type III domain-containing protein [Acidimicrobiia bacterium]